MPFYALLVRFFMPFYAISPSNFMLLCHEIDLLFILSGPRIQVLILTNLPTYSQGNRGLPVIIREIWKLGKWENGKNGNDGKYGRAGHSLFSNCDATTL